jgi:putative ribosome biogenesis GTPase RsgA
MTLFYVAESINAFGESYRELLKVSLKACEKFQQKYGDDAEMDQNKLKSIQTKYGIESDLFDLIIRRVLPRRNQLLITMLKLTSVIIVLIISVQLLVTFDKLKELSLVTHVFTVLFVCALPKIVKMMCFNKHKDMAQRKMKQKVLMTITEYISNKMEVQSRHSSDEHCRLVVPNSGYESLSDSTTDTE